MKFQIKISRNVFTFSPSVSTYKGVIENENGLKTELEISFKSYLYDHDSIPTLQNIEIDIMNKNVSLSLDYVLFSVSNSENDNLGLIHATDTSEETIKKSFLEKTIKHFEG